MKNITTAIFGTSNDSNVAACEYAANVAKLVTNLGYRVMTGGTNSGTMKSAMESADAEARKMQRPELSPIGHAMAHWGVCTAGEIIIHPTYMKRIGALIDGAQNYLILECGTGGTYAEAFMALENVDISIQTESDVPVMILSDRSGKILKAMRESLNQDFNCFRNEKIAEFVFIAEDEKEIKKILTITQKRKEKGVSQEENIFLEKKSIKNYL